MHARRVVQLVEGERGRKRFQKIPRNSAGNSEKSTAWQREEGAYEVARVSNDRKIFERKLWRDRQREKQKSGLTYEYLIYAYVCHAIHYITLMPTSARLVWNLTYDYHEINHSSVESHLENAEEKGTCLVIHPFENWKKVSLSLRFELTVCLGLFGSRKQTDKLKITPIYPRARLKPKQFLDRR